MNKTELKEKMKVLGLTQEKLAELSGKDKARIKDMLDGNMGVKPCIVTIVKSLERHERDK